MSKLYTPEEVAELVGLKRPYVMNLIKEGVLPAKGIGRFKRITQKGLDSFIANLDDSNKGRKMMSEDTRNKIKYHANLKSKKNLPTGIDLMTHNIRKIQEEISVLPEHERVPEIDRLEAAVGLQVEKEKKAEAIPQVLDDLGSKAYPRAKKLVNEDPDKLVERFRNKAMGAQGKQEPQTMKAFHKEQMEVGS